MNKIIKILEELEFSINIKTNSQICTKVEGATIWISVYKDYLGYEVNITEWVNNNFARKHRLRTNTCKNIIKFIKGVLNV